MGLPSSCIPTLTFSVRMCVCTCVSVWRGMKKIESREKDTQGAACAARILRGLGQESRVAWEVASLLSWSWAGLPGRLFPLLWRKDIEPHESEAPIWREGLRLEGLLVQDGWNLVVGLT